MSERVETEVVYSIRNKGGREDWRGVLLDDQEAIREARMWSARYPKSAPYTAHRIARRITTTETEEPVDA